MPVVTLIEGGRYVLGPLSGGDLPPAATPAQSEATAPHLDVHGHFLSVFPGLSTADNRVEVNFDYFPERPTEIIEYADIWSKPAFATLTAPEVLTVLTPCDMGRPRLTHEPGSFHLAVLSRRMPVEFLDPKDPAVHNMILLWPAL